jgi:hypothetical protein
VDPRAHAETGMRTGKTSTPSCWDCSSTRAMRQRNVRWKRSWLEGLIKVPMEIVEERPNTVVNYLWEEDGTGPNQPPGCSTPTAGAISTNDGASVSFRSEGGPVPTARRECGTGPNQPCGSSSGEDNLVAGCQHNLNSNLMFRGSGPAPAHSVSQEKEAPGLTNLPTRNLLGVGSVNCSAAPISEALT